VTNHIIAAKVLYGASCMGLSFNSARITTNKRIKVKCVIKSIYLEQ